MKSQEVLVINQTTRVDFMKATQEFIDSLNSKNLKYTVQYSFCVDKSYDYRYSAMFIVDLENEQCL